MQSGLLIFDNSKSPLAAKITAAAARYQQKFGTPPNAAYVNPNDFTGAINLPTALAVQPKTTILQNHIWLGVNDAPRPVISGAETDGTDASPEPPPMKFAPLTQPREVIVMSLSANTIKAALKYVGIVNRYEDPDRYFNSGLTPREQELIRTKAHNDLISLLAQEGVDVSDRAATTELAQRVDTWIREE